MCGQRNYDNQLHPLLVTLWYVALFFVENYVGCIRMIFFSTCHLIEDFYPNDVVLHDKVNQNNR